MANDNHRRRRGINTGGVKAALAVAALAGSVGGWAAFGLANPTAALGVAETAPAATATAVPSQPSLGRTNPSFEQRSRRRGVAPQTLPNQQPSEGTAPTTPSTEQAPSTFAPQARTRSSR